MYVCEVGRRIGTAKFDISLIFENVLHTHNMYFRPIENFLEAFEVQKVLKNSNFTAFLVSTNSFGVSIKLQKLSSSRVFLQKIILMHAIGPKMFSTYSLDQREHVTYP